MAKPSSRGPGLEPRAALADPRAADPGGAAPRYTIDELVALTKIPGRTIRYYQTARLLPVPERRGRIGLYGPAHVERLELIRTLAARGLTIRAIRALLARIEAGELTLESWLGLAQRLATPPPREGQARWSAEAWAGWLASHGAAQAAGLARAGVVEPRADGGVDVLDVGLLELAGRLADAGLDVAVVGRIREAIDDGMARVAQRVTQRIVAELARLPTPAARVQALEPLISELREVVPQIGLRRLSAALEDALARHVEPRTVTKGRPGRAARRTPRAGP